MSKVCMYIYSPMPLHSVHIHTDHIMGGIEIDDLNTGSCINTASLSNPRLLSVCGETFGRCVKRTGKKVIYLLCVKLELWRGYT